MSAARSGQAVPPSTGELIDLWIDTAYYVKLLGEAAFADTPLSLLSNRVLLAVCDEPGITVSELSRRIPKTQQMISHVAAQLTKLGLLERQLGSTRGVGLHLSQAGQEMAVDGRARQSAMETRVREILGGTRSAALAELLADSRSALKAAR
jgi:DNA-binding MarR family transcriptional regulator